MTTIGPQAYASSSAAAYSRLAPSLQADPQKTAADQTAPASSGQAVNVTLSAAAQAAMKAQGALPSLDSVASAARGTIDKLLADAKATDAVANGEATIDMSGLDRRSLFAVAANQGGGFTTDEQAVAAYTMDNNFQNALAGPVAASRVTGDYAGVYKAGLAYLDKAGPEEKASAGWAQQRDALTKGLQQATATPGSLPAGIPNDLVAAYVTSLGGAAPTTSNRDILKVAGDVRAALDAQYSDPAGAQGDKIDLSPFDDRELAAIALDKGDQFSAQEVAAAKSEIRTRTASSFASYGANGGAATTSSLGSDLIARYAGMSDEERQAQGWTPELYAKLVQNEQLSQRMTSMFGAASSNPYATDANQPMSLLDYLT